MSWEVLEKKTFGAHNYGPEWETRPCVAIRKDGMTFNKVFCETFSIKVGDGLCVRFDAKGQKLGFKVPQNEYELLNAYYLQGERARKKDGKRAGPHAHGPHYPPGVLRVV